MLSLGCGVGDRIRRRGPHDRDGVAAERDDLEHPADERHAIAGCDDPGCGAVLVDHDGELGPGPLHLVPGIEDAG